MHSLYFIKRRCRKPLTALFIIAIAMLANVASAQQPVQIMVTVQQPVSPYLPQLAADIQNQQFGSLSQKLMIRLVNTGNTQKRIKLSGRIERLAPSPMSVALRPDYQPSMPVTLDPRQMIQLDQKLVEQSFGNFSRSQLIFDNLDLSALRQNEVNYKLPEGTYRICVSAYDYDQPGQSAPLSPPGTGCTTFRICYTASAPQFTMPVSTLMAGNTDMTVFTPQSSQITFAWTPPASTCGLPLGRVTYDLEIREMFAGQSVNDAKNNPFVFRQQNLVTNGFILDTLKYPHVFRTGKKYVVRVKANMQKLATSPLEIANQGYSELAAITYSPKPARPPIGGSGLNIPGNVNIVATSGTIAPGNNCQGVEPVTNKTLTQEEITGKDIRVGAFTMHVANATRQGDNYTGKGHITWKPVAGKTILLAVTFAGITINTDYQLVSGVVNTTSNSAIPEWANLSGPDDIPYLSNATDDVLSDLSDAINRVANPIRQISGDAAVNFPLGLNETNIAGATSTMAIMSISFTPTGTDMRMLFNMNIPDANNWLSLAGTGFCIRPEGFSAEKGILYLPSDREVNLDGTVFTLKGAMPVGGILDTTKTTYLKWSGENGFERLFVKADITLPDVLKAINEGGQRTGEKVKMEVAFDFSAWNDWIANINTSGKFEIDNLPGFAINMNEGLYYDHSKNKNPRDIVWPEDEGTHRFLGKDVSYQGIYMKALTMQLPPDFAGIGGTMPTVDFSHLFINGENGLWTDISTSNLLDINKGEIGGWAFSIDKINIPIKNSMPQAASMNGKIGLPVSPARLTYSCNLNTSASGLSYNFIVETGDKYDIPMWAAKLKLDNATNIEIKKEPGKDLIVSANLTGKLDITVSDKTPRIQFTAMKIQGMKLSNYNPEKKKTEFYFFPGNIQFGMMDALPPVASRPRFDAEPFPQETLLARGPSASVLREDLLAVNAMAEDGGTEGASVAGMGITLKDFAPVFNPAGPGGIKLGFRFNLGLNLGYGSLKLKNNTALEVYGMLKDTKKPPVDYAIGIDSIAVKGDLGPVKVEGNLAFRDNDNIWGDGIYGECSVSFPPGISVNANVVFGTVNHFDYFGLGASLYVAGGLATIGPVVINGFGGGFYHNMTIDASGGNSSNPNGKVSFTPSKGDITFQASVALSYVNTTVLKAGMTLSATVNTETGGMSAINLNGNGEFISDGTEEGKGIVNVDIDMTYDFTVDVFDAYAKVYADFYIAKANIPIWLHAGYNGPSVPETETLAQKKERQKKEKNFDFWLYIGRPDEGQKDGHQFEKVTLKLIEINQYPLKVDVGGDAYFCIGSKLPDFPALPHEVETFLNKEGRNTKGSENNNTLLKLKGGGGFMFGASVHGAIDVKLGIFYLDIYAKLGFDVALVHYPQAPPCSVQGKDGTFGFNNWYAMGQLYAYFKADVGFEIDVWFWSGKVSLVALQMGAALQAGLPNPEWMDGRIRITGDVLGGLVRINTGCQFSVGHKCIPAGNPLENIKMITEVGPEGQGVDVFANPYVVFSMPMSDKSNKLISFKTNDSEGNDITRTYKFFVKDWHIAHSEGTLKGKAITSVDNHLSNDGYTMTLVNSDGYNGKTKYDIWVKCEAQELTDKGWGVPKEYQDKNKYADGFTQDSTVLFTTGVSPDSISEKYVVYSYPIKGQRHLMKNEFGKKGVITLFKWNDAFFGLEGATPIYNLTFVAKDNGQRIKTSFVPDKAKRAINFNIPAKLQNNTVYYAYLTVEDKNHKPATTQFQTKQVDLQGTVSINDLNMSIGNYAQNVNFVNSLHPPTQNQSTGVVNTQISHQGDYFRNKTALNTAVQQSPNGAQTNTADQASFFPSLVLDIEPVVDTIALKSKKSEVFQPPSGRVIYSSIFQTSKFGTFKEKMASFGSTFYMNAVNSQKLSYQAIDGGGNWKSEDLSFYDWELTVDQGTEGFDKFEIEGQTRKVNNQYDYIIPPLTHVGIAMDKNKENDKQMYTDVYDPARSFGKQVNFGSPRVRYIPYNNSYSPYLGLQWPLYSFSYDKTRLSNILKMDGTLDGRSGTPVQTPHYLDIVFQRDKVYARDFMLLKKAYVRYSYMRSNISAYYATSAGMGVNFWLFYYQSKGMSVGEAVLAAAQRQEMEEQKYQQYLNDNALLASGPGGANFTIEDKNNFWKDGSFNRNVPGRMEKIRKMKFKSFPSAVRTLTFNYGYDNYNLLNLNSGNDNNSGFRITDYPLSMQEVKVDKTMRVKGVMEDLKFTKVVENEVYIPAVITLP